MTIAGKLFHYEDPNLNTELTRLYDLVQSRLDRHNVDIPDVAQSVSGVLHGASLIDGSAITARTVNADRLDRGLEETVGFRSIEIDQLSSWTNHDPPNIKRFRILGYLEGKTTFGADRVYPFLLWSKEPDPASSLPANRLGPGEALPAGATQTVGSPAAFAYPPGEGAGKTGSFQLADLGDGVVLCMSGSNGCATFTVDIGTTPTPYTRQFMVAYPSATTAETYTWQ